MRGSVEKRTTERKCRDLKQPSGKRRGRGTSLPVCGCCVPSPTFSPLTLWRQEALLLLSECPGSRPPFRLAPPIVWRRAVWVLPAAFADECGAWAASVVLVAPHVTFSVLLARHFRTLLVRLFWAFCVFGVLMFVFLGGWLLQHLFRCMSQKAKLGSWVHFHSSAPEALVGLPPSLYLFVSSCLCPMCHVQSFSCT